METLVRRFWLQSVNNMADVSSACRSKISDNYTSDQYVGETKNQLRDGFGVYHYKNGYFKYEGEWKNGLKHGHGRLSMGDGSYYEGEFTNGEIEGHGYRYWHNSGNTYTGQFLLGELHGDGVMNYPKNNVVYEGEWYRNKRQGQGLLKLPEGTYVGDFHSNKRHGQGTMTYSEEASGDIYDGNWILDVRQGHGQLTSTDGTAYEGQFRSDMKNGDGCMMHSSGVLYDGPWYNDRPVNMATKITLSGLEGPLVVMTQGQAFSVMAECRNEDGTLVPEQGRLLQISAGYKHSVAKEGSGLFDAIEDAEERAYDTPFGYAAVWYPLTEQIGDDLCPAGPGVQGEMDQRSNTNLSSDTTATDPDTADQQIGASVPQKSDPGVDAAVMGDKQTTEISEDVVATTWATDVLESASSPAPPPITPLRTDVGRSEWTGLLLPAAPPLYRPHMIEDEESTSGKKPKSKSKDSKRMSDSEERGGTKTKILGDERFARPGEYIIKVEDLTEPPFLGVRLDPAFILIKLSIDKSRMAKPKAKERKRVK